MKKMLMAATLAVFVAPTVQAADYVIDTKDAHASINFKVKHLGYSWLQGRFNTFSGNFSWDEGKPADTKISVKIDTTSVDTNHTERDKHLRAPDKLNVKEHPEASFVSTKVTEAGDGQFKVEGDFTFNGVTKPLVINAYKVGEGDDPWGGYRAGFAGSTSFAMADYGVERDFGMVELELHIEGIKQ